MAIRRYLTTYEISDLLHLTHLTHPSYTIVLLFCSTSFSGLSVTTFLSHSIKKGSLDRQTWTFLVNAVQYYAFRNPHHHRR